MGILFGRCFDSCKNENEESIEQINHDLPSRKTNNIRQNEIKRDIIIEIKSNNYKKHDFTLSTINNFKQNEIKKDIIIEIKSSNSKKNKDIKDDFILSTINTKQNEIKKEIIKEPIPNNIKYNEEIEEEKKNNIFKNEFELYGFINDGNNCYLNSSLQLLTRIKEMKYEIINYKGNINSETITNGQLFIEFKKILENIENGKNPINPKRLKKVMGEIDIRYFQNNQEDANEFISNFLDGLLDETGDIESLPKPLELNDKDELEAYNKFYNRFYKLKGNSFLLDLFYVILKTQKVCKDCSKFSIKFNEYNIIELPIYELAKKNRNKELNFKEIFQNFFRKNENIDGKCKYCGSSNIYELTNLYKLSKYLIFYFGRTVNDEYINNTIIYPEEIDLKVDGNSKYKLQCTIEHSGGAHYGHYTSLCYISKVKKWHNFSDTSFYPNNNGFHGDNAIILLYKKIK